MRCRRLIQSLPYLRPRLPPCRTGPLAPVHPWSTLVGLLVSAANQRSYNRSLRAWESRAPGLRAAASATATALGRRILLVRVHAPRQYEPLRVALAALQGVPDEPRELAVLGIRTLASEWVRVEVWRGGRVVEVWMAI